MYVIARSVSDDAILLMAGLLRFARNDMCVECSPQTNGRGIAQDAKRLERKGGQGKCFCLQKNVWKVSPLSYAFSLLGNPQTFSVKDVRLASYGGIEKLCTLMIIIFFW